MKAITTTPIITVPGIWMLGKNTIDENTLTEFSKIISNF
jgi:hypothetical protein